MALYHHHRFTDPAKAQGSEAEVQAAFHRVRDEVKEYCRDFLERFI